MPKSSVDATAKALFRIATKKMLPKSRPGGAAKPGGAVKLKEPRSLSLVTGASGRVGTQLVAALLERGDVVRVLHRASEKNPSYPMGVDVVEGDLSDPKSLERAVDGVDYVFHCAAIVDPTAPPEKLLDVNYRGTRKLLEACRARAYQLKRFVHLSTIAIYGKRIETMPATESTPANPSDPYGQSKWLGEQVVQQYADKLPVVILRPGVVYGPGFAEGYFQVLRLLEKGRMRVIGNGSNNIPLTHVRDLVKAMLLASKADRVQGKVFVITGEPRTQRQLLELAAKELGVEPPRARISPWRAKLQLKIARIFGRGGGLTEDYIDILASNRVFDSGRARKELGYAPAVSAEDGIRDAVQGYREARK